jgi:hypothetical protein
MQSLLDNLINGNLTTAKKQASRFSHSKLTAFFADFMSPAKARAAADYLRPRRGEDRNALFQAYCDA